MATTNAVQGKLIRLLSKYSNVFYFTACSTIAASSKKIN